MRFKVGYTKPRGVPEHRELRHHRHRHGFSAGVVTRTHGTLWLSVRWWRS